MYWIELLDILKNMELPKKDIIEANLIIEFAVVFYQSRHHYSPKTLETDVVKFEINGRYIKQSNLLTSLGIIVEPRQWKEEINYSKEIYDFGPLYDFKRKEDKVTTLVTFPFSLISVDTKNDIERKLNNTSKVRERVKYKNVRHLGSCGPY